MSHGLHSHCVTKLSHIIIQKGVVMASLNEYSEEEVARHNTIEDCWVTLTDEANEEELVYDFTPFLNKHPGGPNSIVKYAGRNGDESFRLKPVHYNYAKERIPPYLIGKLVRKPQSEGSANVGEEPTGNA